MDHVLRRAKRRREVSTTGESLDAREVTAHRGGRRRRASTVIRCNAGSRRQGGDGVGISRLRSQRRCELREAALAPMGGSATSWTPTSVGRKRHRLRCRSRRRNHLPWTLGTCSCWAKLWWIGVSGARARACAALVGDEREREPLCHGRPGQRVLPPDFEGNDASSPHEETQK